MKPGDMQEQEAPNAGWATHFRTFLPFFLCTSVAVVVLSFCLVDLWAGERRPKFEKRVPDMKTFDVFQGIHPEKIGNFWEKWPLVTVRYRKDLDELRLVYANPVAWKAIQRGGLSVFPQGSIFGKVAFKTTADPSFAVSQVPESNMRIQLMVKNSSAYPHSGGWGYAIYPAKRRGDSSPENVVEACFACHKIVQKKDYVFSEPAYFFDPIRKAQESKIHFKDQFSLKTFKELTALQKTIIKKYVGEVPQIRIAQVPLFNGSLSENITPISEASAEEKIPYFLLDDQSSHFILSIPQQGSTGCPKLVKIFSMMDVSPQSKGEGMSPQRVVRLSSYCDGKVRHLVDQLIHAP